LPLQKRAPSATEQRIRGEELSRDVFGASEAAIDLPMNVCAAPVTGGDVSMSGSGGPRTVIEGSLRLSGALATKMWPLWT